jgi:hypothetical protein
VLFQLLSTSVLVQATLELAIIGTINFTGNATAVPLAIAYFPESSNSFGWASAYILAGESDIYTDGAGQYYQVSGDSNLYFLDTSINVLYDPPTITGFYWRVDAAYFRVFNSLSPSEAWYFCDASGATEYNLDQGEPYPIHCELLVMISRTATKNLVGAQYSYYGLQAVYYDSDEFDNYTSALVTVYIFDENTLVYLWKITPNELNFNPSLVVDIELDLVTFDYSVFIFFASINAVGSYPLRTSPIPPYAPPVPRIAYMSAFFSNVSADNIELLPLNSSSFSQSSAYTCQYRYGYRTQSFDTYINGNLQRSFVMDWDNNVYGVINCGPGQQNVAVLIGSYFPYVSIGQAPTNIYGYILLSTLPYYTAALTRNFKLEFYSGSSMQNFIPVGSYYNAEQTFFLVDDLTDGYSVVFTSEVGVTNLTTIYSSAFPTYAALNQWGGYLTVTADTVDATQWSYSYAPANYWCDGFYAFNGTATESAIPVTPYSQFIVLIDSDYGEDAEYGYGCNAIGYNQAGAYISDQVLGNLTMTLFAPITYDYY